MTHYEYIKECTDKNALALSFAMQSGKVSALLFNSCAQIAKGESNPVTEKEVALTYVKLWREWLESPAEVSTNG